MDKSSCPNLLLIAGDGRKTGKTTLACNIIGKIGQSEAVYGIKISPHFHPLPDEARIIERSEDYIIMEETASSGNKDSALMLRAGAARVFYIQATENGLATAWMSITKLTGTKVPLVCESGGLIGFVKPGLFLFCPGRFPYTAKSKTPDLIAKADHLVNGNIQEICDRICFSQSGWKLD
jgi:hypothetical protein